MELNNKIKALVAVGASITANCQPCLQSAAQLALDCGADAQEVEAAIEVGKKVRTGAVSRMDHFILDLNEVALTGAISDNAGCGCISPENITEVKKNG